MTSHANLENSGASMEKNEEVEDVAELVGYPECTEDVSSWRLCGEHVDDCQNNDKKNTGKTCDVTT